MSKLGPCVEWEGAKCRGYGRVGKSQYAHRAAWERANGNIPKGICVLHKCDNPACVNVDHLFLGTHADNMADMVKKGRSPRSNGEKDGNSKLTEDQVRAIRTDNRLHRKIAAEYGVTRANISYIKRRNTWRHLDA